MREIVHEGERRRERRGRMTGDRWSESRREGGGDREETMTRTGGGRRACDHVTSWRSAWLADERHFIPPEPLLACSRHRHPKVSGDGRLAQRLRIVPDVAMFSLISEVSLTVIDCNIFILYLLYSKYASDRSRTLRRLCFAAKIISFLSLQPYVKELFTKRSCWEIQIAENDACEKEKHARSLFLRLTRLTVGEGCVLTSGIRDI